MGTGGEPERAGVGTMILRIVNTNGTGGYGIDEIMHSEQVANLNAAERAYEEWCSRNLRDHDRRPRGVVVDEDGNEYDAASGALIES
jgi:hypothetical protein